MTTDGANVPWYDRDLFLDVEDVADGFVDGLRPGPDWEKRFIILLLLADLLIEKKK